MAPKAIPNVRRFETFERRGHGRRVTDELSRWSSTSPGSVFAVVDCSRSKTRNVTEMDKRVRSNRAEDTYDNNLNGPERKWSTTTNDRRKSRRRSPRMFRKLFRPIESWYFNYARRHSGATSTFVKSGRFATKSFRPSTDRCTTSVPTEVPRQIALGIRYDCVVVVVHDRRVQNIIAFTPSGWPGRNRILFT